MEHKGTVRSETDRQYIVDSCFYSMLREKWQNNR